MINSVLVYLQNYEILFLLIQMKSIIHKCKYALKKITNTINEELELDKSDCEFNKFDEYQHIYDGLH